MGKSMVTEFRANLCKNLRILALAYIFALPESAMSMPQTGPVFTGGDIENVQDRNQNDIERRLIASRRTLLAGIYGIPAIMAVGISAWGTNAGLFCEEDCDLIYPWKVGRFRCELRNRYCHSILAGKRFRFIAWPTAISLIILGKRRKNLLLEESIERTPPWTEKRRLLAVAASSGVLLTVGSILISNLDNAREMRTNSEFWNNSHGRERKRLGFATAGGALLYSGGVGAVSTLVNLFQWLEARSSRFNNELDVAISPNRIDIGISF